METSNHKFLVSDNIGEVSAIVDQINEPWCALTLAHGAGAGMSHPFMSLLANALALHGVLVMRFNFPFTEAKKKRPDFAPVAEKTIEAAIGYLQSLAGTLPVFAAGKSFGGRMSSQHLSHHPATKVRGIVFFGFPLHAANQPGIQRSEHLKMINLPMLFLQGTRDALAQLPLIEQVTTSLSFAELQTFEGADHAFMRGKTLLVDHLANAAGEWLTRQCAVR